MFFYDYIVEIIGQNDAKKNVEIMINAIISNRNEDARIDLFSRMIGCNEGETLSHAIFERFLIMI